MSAYRQYKHGIRARSGAPVMDIETGEPLKLTSGEAIAKSLGFYPDRLAQQRDVQNYLNYKEGEQRNRTQAWADRWVLAGIYYSEEEAREIRRGIVEEIVNYNMKMHRRGRTQDELGPDNIMAILEEAGVLKKIEDREDYINLPSQQLLPDFIEAIRKQYGIKGD